jgi:hypothetical protein
MSILNGDKGGTGNDFSQSVAGSYYTVLNGEIVEALPPDPEVTLDPVAKSITIFPGEPGLWGFNIYLSGQGDLKQINGIDYECAITLCAANAACDIIVYADDTYQNYIYFPNGPIIEIIEDARLILAYDTTNLLWRVLRYYKTELT